MLIGCVRVTDVRVIDTIDLRSYANRETVWGGKYVPCTRRTAQVKDFELILTVKMETRYPVGRPLDREFSVVVIIAEL